MCVAAAVAGCGGSDRSKEASGHVPASTEGASVMSAVHVPAGFVRTACGGLDDGQVCFSRRQSIVLGKRAFGHVIRSFGLEPRASSLECVPRARPVKPSLRVEHCRSIATTGRHLFAVAAASAVMASRYSVTSVRGGLASEQNAGTRLEVDETEAQSSRAVDSSLAWKRQLSRG